MTERLSFDLLKLFLFFLLLLIIIAMCQTEFLCWNLLIHELFLSPNRV